jgi:N-acetylmuramoyl-L-alanine amidase
MGHGGGTIKHNKIYALLFAMCMVVAVIPMAGAVTDQNSEKSIITNVNQVQLVVTGAEAQQIQSTLQEKKPFGTQSEKVLAQTNQAVNTDPNPNVLELGDSGDKVKQLQTWLTDYGYYTGSIDGNFGAVTEKAVKQFQLEASIKVDGKVGKETTTAMEKWDQLLAKVQAAAGDSDTASTTATSSKSISTARKTYAKSYAKAVRHYRGGKGSGDCWTNSAALYSQLTGSGQKARIIQYASSLSPRHRSVQVYSNGAWVNYDYKANGYAQTYYATSNSVNGKVVQ